MTDTASDSHGLPYIAKSGARIPKNGASIDDHSDHDRVPQVHTFAPVISIFAKPAGLV